LEAFSIGNSRSAAKEFAKNLNVWKEKFGRPEIEVKYSGTKDKARSLNGKYAIRKIKYYFFYFIPVSLIIIYIFTIRSIF